MFIKYFWFLGNPIETKIGICNFIKVKDYEKLLFCCSVLEVDKCYAIQAIREQNKDIPDIDYIISSFNNESFLYIIREVKWLGLYDGYINLFNFCFENKNAFDLIETDEELNFYVDLIKEMNHISFEKPSGNAELDYYDKLKRISQERKGEIVTFKSMVMNVGLYKNDVFDLPIYCLYEYFSTIETNKNYKTSTLYQTVSIEQLKILPWYADISINKTTLNDKDKEFINKHLRIVKNDPSKNQNSTVKQINDLTKYKNNLGGM